MTNPIEKLAEKLSLAYAERIEDACLEQLPEWARRAYHWHPILRNPALWLAMRMVGLTLNHYPDHTAIVIRGKEVADIYPPCPLGICDGDGITVENAGCCGGCEVCGSREETEKPCPHTL